MDIGENSKCFGPVDDVFVAEEILEIFFEPLRPACFVLHQKLVSLLWRHELDFERFFGKVRAVVLEAEVAAVLAVKFEVPH